MELLSHHNSVSQSLIGNLLLYMYMSPFGFVSLKKSNTRIYGVYSPIQKNIFANTVVMKYKDIGSRWGPPSYFDYLKNKHRLYFFIVFNVTISKSILMNTQLNQISVYSPVPPLQHSSEVSTFLNGKFPYWVRPRGGRAQCGKQTFPGTDRRDQSKLIRFPNLVLSASSCLTLAKTFHFTETLFSPI